MLSLQEMSDRLEIQELFTLYAHAIDDRDYALFDSVFSPDAVIDYSEVGGAKLPRDEMKGWLKDAMKDYPTFQHLSATSRIQIDGDTAKSRTILFNPMVMTHEGEERVFFVGLWYNDTLARTADGWRITSRREEKSWNYNAPTGLMP